jgi:hypothetical protein
VNKFDQVEFAIAISDACDTSAQGVSWERISFMATEFFDFKPEEHRSGFMVVRGALQMAIDADLIERTNDVHNEIYVSKA